MADREEHGDLHDRCDLDLLDGALLACSMLRVV